MNKLSRKDIAMLEVLAVTEESKGKLAEYVQQREKTAKAYKAFREAVVSGIDVDKVEKVVEVNRKFKAGDKVRVKDTSFFVATSALDVGDITKVVGYKEDFEEYELLAQKERPVVVAEPKGETGLFEESALELAEEKTPNELRAEVIQRAKEFIENAVQPNEVLGPVVNGNEVLGPVVNGNEVLGPCRQDRKFTLTSKKDCDSFHYPECSEYNPDNHVDFIYNWQIGDIIDDTNAIYKEGTE